MNNGIHGGERSDDTIRSLERSYCTDSTSSSEFALAKERFRAGQISMDRMQIAAHCGDKYACALVQRESLSSLPFEKWIDVFDQSEKIVAIRVEIIIASRRIHEFPEGEGRDLLILALKKCFDFAACPCSRHEELVKQAYLSVRNVYYSPLLGADTPQRSRAGASVVHLADDIGLPEAVPYSSLWLSVIANNVASDFSSSEIESLKGDISKRMSRWLIFGDEFLRELVIPNPSGVSSTRPTRPERKPAAKKSKKK